MCFRGCGGEESWHSTECEAARVGPSQGKGGSMTEPRTLSRVGMAVRVLNAYSGRPCGLPLDRLCLLRTPTGKLCGARCAIHAYERNHLARASGIPIRTPRREREFSLISSGSRPLPSPERAHAGKRLGSRNRALGGDGRSGLAQPHSLPWIHYMRHPATSWTVT